jgi:thiamine biosynthesis lipoprotein
MGLSRRRFLTLASAACLAAGHAGAYEWRGTALGARARILLDHPQAAALSAAARAEISRLEDVFSLYRTGSALSRLNRDGRLAAPPFELLDCLALARRVHRATDGAFDPTVQPVWAALAEGHLSPRGPDPERLAAARASVGFDQVRFDAGSVRLGPGQALTLNGIAQGIIADRVADLMRDEGIDDVLIDTGEMIGLGDWPARISGTDAQVALRNRALATSATRGTVLDGAGKVGHILRPGGGTVPARQVSVSAPRAGLADALSTGLCLVPGREAAEHIVASLGDARLEAFVE